MNDIKVTVETSYAYDHRDDLERDQRRRKEKDELEGNQALYQPTLWWFASTVFPLIAGAFGPVANLFSICALVQTWRIDIVNGTHVPDPAWLIVLNVCSLTLAITANLILLFNFAHRIRYTLAQPLTISLWYLSSAFLAIPIGLTRLARFSPATHPTFMYSQSFYYALMSSVIYSTISTLLLLNLIGASRPVHAYPPTFATLTYPQRTLMLQTISLSLYLALGGGVFGAIEHWSFTDGVYWADYTILTIGLGSDFPLKKTLSRMLLMPYAAFGITLIGLVVGSVRGLVLERAKEKVVVRHLEKERDRWGDNIHKTMQKTEGESKTSITPPISLFHCWHYGRDKKFQHLPREIAAAADTKSIPHQDQHKKWHHAEFELMRYIQLTGEQTERYAALVVSFMAFLVVWVGGSLVFWVCERKHQQWTYPESLYFTYTTLLTIGYGDFFPTSSPGKPFFVVWSLVAVPTMTVLIGNMGDTVAQTVKEITDWMGRKTVLAESRRKDAKRKEEESGEEKKDGVPGGIREWPISDPGMSLPPTFSPGPTFSVRDYADLPLATPSGEGREAIVASPTELSSEPEEKERPAYAFQSPLAQPSEGEHSGHNNNTSQIQTEAALLAREISKLAKDVCEQPPKKYGWDEWVIWLKMLGDEGVAVELERHDDEAEPATNDIQVEPRTHHHHHHKRHRRYHSYPNTHVGIGRGGEDGWHWTWLDDKGPLFSQQTETEWILSRLCGRLEHLMDHD